MVWMGTSSGADRSHYRSHSHYDQLFPGFSRRVFPHIHLTGIDPGGVVHNPIHDRIGMNSCQAPGFVEGHVCVDQAAWA